MTVREPKPQHLLVDCGKTFEEATRRDVPFRLPETWSGLGRSDSDPKIRDIETGRPHFFRRFCVPHLLVYKSPELERGGSADGALRVGDCPRRVRNRSRPKSKTDPKRIDP